MLTKYKLMSFVIALVISTASLLISSSAQATGTDNIFLFGAYDYTKKEWKPFVTDDLLQ